MQLKSEQMLKIDYISARYGLFSLDKQNHQNATYVNAQQGCII